ncbi:MAG TPA: DUF4175 family protein [Tepidisphaeraceae bacterium]|nr:DUF4175 family protein [Tepidisphaeraceae bacterium]
MPPTAILESLQAVRRKVRALRVAYGAGLAVAAAVALLLLTVFFDWLLGLGRAPRLILMLASLGTLGYVLWHWLLVPALTKLKLGDVAGRMERTFPEFDDRLRSTVDFMQSKVPGSETMQQKVASEAAELAKKINLDHVIVRGPVYASVAGAVFAAAILAGALTLGGRNGLLGIAADRLMLGDRQWPKSVEIALDGKLPSRVPVGQRIPVKIKLAKGDRESRTATIFYRYDNGPWQREIMTRKDGEYTALLDARLEQGHKDASLQVKLEAGDDAVALNPIAVVPRLEVARVDADVTPPPYVQPAVASSVNLAERPAIMAYGSQVGVRINFNKPLKPDAPIEIRPVKEGQKLPAMTWDRSVAGTAVAHFQAEQSFRFSVKATDTDGFHNAGGEEYELLVREDSPPSVTIEEPKRSEDRTPNAAFDIKAMAEDDYGILGAQLVVNRTADNKNPSVKNNWVIDLVKDGNVAAQDTSWVPGDSNPERKRYHLTYNWQLATLEGANLKPGDILEFYVQVKDNFRLNGKEHDWVPSSKLRVTIVSLEQFMQQMQANVEQVQGQIKAEHLAELRQKAETQTLKEGLDRTKKFDEADKSQANRLATDQSTTQSHTMQLSDRLEQLVQKMAENKAPEGGLKDAAQAVAKQLQNAADGAMREAKQNLDAAKDAPQDPKADPKQQATDAKQRQQAMDKASDKQQQAADQLQQAMDKLGQMGGLSEAIAKMEQMAKDQKKVEDDFNKANKDNIGKKPDELSKDAQDQNKKLSDKQNDLAKQMDQALANMDKKSDQMQKSDPSASQAMKQAAQMGQQQGLPSKQQSAAQSMQQNQQAQAQQSQKQVELGIDQILNKLREAERKRLEELAKQLAQMQQLMAELIQRQAGHNIDNLLIQGGQKRLDQVDTKEREDLIAMSGRDPKNLPAAPQIPQLSASQEQTERNARDVAKQAESLPDPAPAAKITQAAGHMERAIVHLRNTKLTDAYDPPQVEALRALAEAKRQVDAALAEAQKQLEEKDAETIKQAYVKLLEEQKKIGVEIPRIDGTQRDANGDLPRDVSVKLGQLPTAQGELVAKAEDIGKKLKQLDSIVFDWANKDILKAMGDVKDNLAKPDTGKPTQVAEKHAEDQIQAMIDSLVQKMKESKFDQRGGGGGGGGSPKAKLPAEAELRLLKKNQTAVRTGTEEADKVAQKDKEQLLALGTRQGELRDLFDKLIQKATEGQNKLGPEPDPNEQLPEEANKEDIENQEIEQGLLNDKVTDDMAEKGLKLTGDRMARSRVRLAVKDDPGKVTQEIQKRIEIDIDELIKMAQQQQANSKPKPGSKPGQKNGPPQPQPGPGQQQLAQGKSGQKPNPGATPADKSSLAQAGDPNVDPNGNVKVKVEEWGSVTARERQAVQEGAHETVIGKYKGLVDDYYRSLAEQATKR